MHMRAMGRTIHPVTRCETCTTHVAPEDLTAGNFTWGMIGWNLRIPFVFVRDPGHHEGEANGQAVGTSAPDSKSR